MRFSPDEPAEGFKYGSIERAAPPITSRGSLEQLEASSSDALDAGGAGATEALKNCDCVGTAEAPGEARLPTVVSMPSRGKAPPPRGPSAVSFPELELSAPQREGSAAKRELSRARGSMGAGLRPKRMSHGLSFLRASTSRRWPHAAPSAQQRAV